MNQIETQEQFYQKFYHALEQELSPEGMDLQEVEIYKNNVVLKGISVRCEDQMAAPVIYPESFFEDYSKGISFKEIIPYVKDILKNAFKKIEDLLNLPSHENAKENLRSAVVNYERNKDFLKHIPHERVADLAVYAKWRVEGQYAVTITNHLLSHLQLTKEELLKIAKENTAKNMTFQSMGGFIADIVSRNQNDPELAEEDFRLMQSELKPTNAFWILSTKDGLDGAALIADPAVMKMVCRKFPEGFYILPSSIHETLIVPKRDGLEIDKLRDMVKSVNQEMVSIEEQLSDNVYEYEQGLFMAWQTESIEKDFPYCEIKHRR